MDYSDYVTVKFTRVKYSGEPAHWECDVYIKDNIEMGGGTAPTLGGVIDIAASIMYPLLSRFLASRQRQRR